jgi:hypothetical protein
MVNTATKLIWTSFREDATKFAGSMQVRAEDILNLPQFTFGMHSRKQGFMPIKGEPDSLADFPRREDTEALQRDMEAKYGPSLNDGDVPPDDPDTDRGTGEPDPKPSDDGGSGKPPDVEVI